MDESPLGPLIAKQPPEEPGYWGYNCMILIRLGRSSGVDLVAWPARDGDAAVMTFMISHAAIVDEKDLGPNTDAAARGMTRFDPAESWRKASIPRPGRHWTAPDLSRCQASPAARWKETVCLEPD